MPAAAIAAFFGPAAIEVRKTSRESGPGEIVMRAPVTVKLSSAIHVDTSVPSLARQVYELSETLASYSLQKLTTSRRGGNGGQHAAYPKSIFAHNSLVEAEVMSELSMGRDVNFEVRFNRAGPVPVDIKLGQL